MVTETGSIDYFELEKDAVGALGAHWQLHKSLDYIKECFSGKYADAFMIADIGLNLIGDGVKQPWDGLGEDPRRHFLDITQAIFNAMHPGSYTEIREALDGNHPRDVLIPKAGEEITSDHARNINKAFYSLYGRREDERVDFTKDLLEEFVDGLYMKLDKEGGLFSQGELEDYYRRVQCVPTAICLNAAVDLRKELPASYGDFYDSLNKISQGIKIIKKCRESDIKEGLDRNMVYFSKEDLDDAGLTRDEFVRIVGYGKEDARLSGLVKKNVHRANVYFRKGVDALMSLPNDGIWTDVKRFAAAYGGLVKHWAEELGREGYNPLNGKGYMNPGDEGTIFRTASLAGRSKSQDETLKNQILNWQGLDTNLLEKMGNQSEYGA
jgi:phytoene/squalene synthetase